MLSFGILVLPKTVLSIWYVFFVDFAITTYKSNNCFLLSAILNFELFPPLPSLRTGMLWDCVYSQRAARSFVRRLEIRLKTQNLCKIVSFEKTYITTQFFPIFSRKMMALVQTYVLINWIVFCTTMLIKYNNVCIYYETPVTINCYCMGAVLPHSQSL